jgi:hypothetical protein
MITASTGTGMWLEEKVGATWPITGYFLSLVKTTKTKSRGYVGNSFALVAWMALATAEAQNLAPPPARLSTPGSSGRPAAPTQELPALPGQQPIQQQIIQRSSATDAARYLAGMPLSAKSPLTRLTSEPALDRALQHNERRVLQT